MQKILISICVSIVILIGVFCAGYYYGNKARDIESQNIIADLEKRNIALGGRIDNLIESARVNAERSAELEEAIGKLASGIDENLRRSKGITDRAKRIDALAKAIDGAIDELIKTLEVLENSGGIVGGSGDN